MESGSIARYGHRNEQATYRIVGKEHRRFVSPRRTTEPGRSPRPFQQPSERSHLPPCFLRRGHRTNVDEDARWLEIRGRGGVQRRCKSCTIVDDVELLVCRGVVCLEMFDE